MASRTGSRPASAPAPTAGLVLPDQPGDDAFDVAIGLMAGSPDHQSTLNGSQTLHTGASEDDDLARQEAELDAREARIARLEARRRDLAARERAMSFVAPAEPLPVADLAPVGMPDTARIVLEDNDNIPPTGLPLGFNGRTFHLRPGMEVNVPLCLIEILDNSVMSVPIVNPESLKVTGYRKRLRFPYRRLSAERFAA